ncbi:cell division protein FtsN [Rhodopseudomonas julia]|uniref:Cell division protein FtsN n=1 Tax=Rhodopseudomonas julia TaxID=200617 RepID=A0ABU0CA33_9BRAD|nr:SPOR domain-containing protein [Rhodopseudomonas julia]MDQ0327062.1 cell division protein FtsN [Rhodopseudomonas julia]
MADERPKTSYSHHGPGGGPAGPEEEDPLVELARIVSEDSSYYRPSPRAEAAPARREPEVDAFSSELEAELMREFEQSNRPRQPETRTPETYTRAEPRFAPAPPQEPEADASWQSYEPRAEHPLASLVTRFPSGPAAEEGYDDSRSASEDRYASSEPYGAHEDPRQSPGYEEPSQEPYDPPEGAYAESHRDAARDFAHWMEHELPGELAAQSVRQEPSWTEPEQGGADYRSAERSDSLVGERGPQARDPYVPHVQSGAPRAEGDWPASDDLADTPEPSPEEFPFLVDSDPLVSRADGDPDGQIRMDDEGGERKGRRKGLMVLAGVLGVVVIGGGVIAMLGGGDGDSDGSVPVITADGGDVKVAVESPGDNKDNEVGQAVFDRVSGRSPETDEKLVDRNEEPREIARIVLPNAQDGETADGAAATGDDEGKISARISDDTAQPLVGPQVTPIGPKKVRTLTVRPDGTIVENAPSAGAATSQEPTELAGPAPATDPEPVQVQSVRVQPEDGGMPADATAGNDAQASAEPNGLGETPTSAETPSFDIASLPQARPTVPDLVAPSPSAAQTAPQPTASAAALTASAPASNASEPQVASTAPAGWAVQVSSQRSEEQARSSYSNLQRRFPSLLGGQEAMILQADLGDKGIYYRVRVGPMASREAAISLCENLQSAGGSCFVTQ